MQFLVTVAFALAALQATPTFVASVRPNADSVLTFSGITTLAKGQLRGKAMTMKELVAAAYSIQHRDIVGGPAWFATARFDIEARAGDDAGEAQLRLMLQALLAERFKLRLHRESREGPVYALVVSAAGAKLKRSTGDDCKESVGLVTLVGRVVGKCGSAAGLATSLSSVLDRPVVDRTNLSETFVDVKLDWVPDETQFADWGPGAYARPVSDRSGPALFTAVQEQLGLRLESSRAPIAVVVIDAAERPTAN